MAPINSLGRLVYGDASVFTLVLKPSLLQPLKNSNVGAVEEVNALFPVAQRGLP